MLLALMRHSIEKVSLGNYTIHALNLLFLEEKFSLPKEAIVQDQLDI
jgi:hypothetical protein